MLLESKKLIFAFQCPVFDTKCLIEKTYLKIFLNQLLPILLYFKTESLVSENKEAWGKRFAWNIHPVLNSLIQLYFGTIRAAAGSQG